MKGKRKRSKYFFKPGHIPHNKGKEVEKMSPESSVVPKVLPWKRVTDETFALVTKTNVDGKSYSIPDVDGKQGSARFLRPKSGTQQDPANLKKEEIGQGNRVVTWYKIAEMMNSVYLLHSKQDVSCNNLHIELIKEVKLGWGWKSQWKCSECKFVSPCYNTYEELKTGNPGPNPVAMNRTFQTALQDTPMGNRRARFLFAGGLDIPPPAKGTMQRHANIVSKQIKELNEKDMKEKREMVKAINEARGVENPNHIPSSIDVRYNTTQIVSTKKPGQNASQAVGISCELVTDKKFIIAAVFHNKLCWTGAWLMNKGFDVSCPDGHEGVCTANVKATLPLSEYLIGREIGTALAMQDVLVKYAVTDGDGRSAQGINDAIKVLHPMWKVERLADPTHLGRSQFRQSNSAKFSHTMFPGATRETKKVEQRVLSQDIKARCSLVFNEVWKENCGNFEKIKKRLPKILEATLSCYDGDCSKCRANSYVCGGGHSNSWWLRSMFLASHKLSNLYMNENDKLILQELLKMKLSEDALLSMRFNFDTQKCEAVNRALSVSLPKNTNFGRNFEGRASSSIHSVNNGLSTSIQEKQKHIGYSISLRSGKCLDGIQKEMEQNRKYQKSPARKKETMKQRGKKIQAHIQQGQIKKMPDTYIKGQLDPKLDTSLVRSTRKDHPYGFQLGLTTRNSDPHGNSSSNSD